MWKLVIQSQRLAQFVSLFLQGIKSNLSACLWLLFWTSPPPPNVHCPEWIFLSPWLILPLSHTLFYQLHSLVLITSGITFIFFSSYLLIIHFDKRANTSVFNVFSPNAQRSEKELKTYSWINNPINWLGKISRNCGIS